MRALRPAIAVSIVAAGAALLALASLPVLAEGPPADTTPPTGTLTVNGGASVTSSLQLHLGVAATDDVGVTGVQVVFDGGFVGGQVAYAPAITALMPTGTPDGWHTVSVGWFDAAGNAGWSDGVEVQLDREAPNIDTPQWQEDTDAGDVLMPVKVPSLDGWPIASLEFSVDGTTWGAPVPYAAVVDYSFLDPALGGSSRLGPRTVYVRAVDAAGNVSATVSKAWHASVAAPIKVSPDAPTTGHRITLTPQYPAPISWPAGTHCLWEVAWGDDQSLYYANYDDTYGFFHTYGPASKGYCDARSFTLPWMPYPQVSVSFRALPGADGGDAMVAESIGASPEEEAIVPIVDSTSRRITESNVPMVYVLPEDYILVLGQPTTYQAYSVAGAPIGSRDVWMVNYIDTPDLQYGGTSLTFTPRHTGYITVCWNSDTLKSTRFSACYDPPVKRKDVYRPNTSKPAQTIGTTTIGGTTVPVTLTWSGSDRGWGIAKYQLDRSTDGKAWKRVLSRRTKTYAASLAPGHTYRFRVRAIDKYGNVGSWDYGNTFRPVLVDDASATVVYSGTWAAVSDASARGKSLHESGTAGSVARYTFTGRDVAWLAERGPGHGRAKVYVDGRLVVTVDLNGAADAPARVVFKRHWTVKATHTVRIVVQGTAGRPTVGIDGFAVLR